MNNQYGDGQSAEQNQPGVSGQRSQQPSPMNQNQDAPGYGDQGPSGRGGQMQSDDSDMSSDTDEPDDDMADSAPAATGQGGMGSEGSPGSTDRSSTDMDDGSASPDQKM